MPNAPPADKMPDSRSVGDPNKELGFREIRRIGIKVYGGRNPLDQLGHLWAVIDIAIRKKRIQLFHGNGLENCGTRLAAKLECDWEPRHPVRDDAIRRAWLKHHRVAFGIRKTWL
jgi:hypothetical protein